MSYIHCKYRQNTRVLLAKIIISKLKAYTLINCQPETSKRVILLVVHGQPMIISYDVVQMYPSFHIIEQEIIQFYFIISKQKKLVSKLSYCADFVIHHYGNYHLIHMEPDIRYIVWISNSFKIEHILSLTYRDNIFHYSQLL